MTLIANVYCQESDLQERFSPAAVTAWADQNGNNTEYTNTVDDAINQASQEIEGYARQRYTPAGLSGCDLIKRWCVTLAGFYLSTTRGNPAPASIEKEYGRILAKLEKVAAGTFQLPGVALRSDTRPTWSNLRVDRQYTQTKIRVEQQGSSQAPTTLSQNLDGSFGQIP